MNGEIIIKPRIRRKLVVKNFGTIFLFIIIISVLIVISFLQFRTPTVIPAKEKLDHFSAERAMSFLQGVAAAPHPTGSEKHAKVREYLVAKLMELGISPNVHSFEGVAPLWGEPFSGQVNNIVARIDGEDPSMTIMIVAHYDSVPESPGAADNGAGVAAIIETARILTQDKNLKNDIIILLTDGEEIGLLGAKGFVERHPWSAEVDLVLNFEARGSSGPSIIFETNDGNSALISEFIKGAPPNLLAHSFIHELYNQLPHGTDLTIFKNAGMQGINFGFFADSSTYHTLADNIENISLVSLQQHGDNMFYLVNHFGNSEFILRNEDNKIFFNVFGKKLITYSEKLVMPIMGITVFFFILSFIHGYLCKELTLGGFSIGFFLFIIIILFSAFFGKIIWKLISSFWGGNIQVVENEFIISSAVFLGILLIINVFIFIIYILATKKVKLFNLIMGGYFCWLLALVISSISFKGASYIFAWPIIFSLIGFNILLRIKNTNSFIGFAITVCSAIPAILICVPALYLLYLFFMPEEISILLAVAASVTMFLLPILSSLNKRITVD